MVQFLPILFASGFTYEFIFIREESSFHLHGFANIQDDNFFFFRKTLSTVLSRGLMIMIMTLVEIINEIPQDFERQANRGDERSAYLTHAVPNHYLLSMSEVGIKILVILLVRSIL